MGINGRIPVWQIPDKKNSWHIPTLQDPGGTNWRSSNVTRSCLCDTLIFLMELMGGFPYDKLLKELTDGILWRNPMR